MLSITYLLFLQVKNVALLKESSPNDNEKDLPKHPLKKSEEKAQEIHNQIHNQRHYRMSLRQDLEQCSVGMGLDDADLQEENFEKAVQFALHFIDFYQSVIPKSFLASYKNPCWYSNLSQDAISVLSQLDSSAVLTPNYLKELTHLVFKKTHSKIQLICLPYFFVAGFPKSATTTLDEGLRKHPQIIGPTRKEPHWWTRGAHSRESSKDRGALSVTQYSLFFQPVADALTSTSVSNLITYDASQSTLWHSPLTGGLDYCILPALMSRLLPDTKFVVMMRNPVDRLISHCIWSCKYHNGDDIRQWPPEVLENGPKLLHNQVVELTKSFEKCTETASTYKCASTRFEYVSVRPGAIINHSLGFSRTLKSIPVANECGKIGHRLDIGLYHVHIRKWLKFFPMKQFLFLRMEDLISDPFETMQKLTVFLDIDPISRDDTKQWFSEKINKRTKEQDSIFRIKPSTIQLLNSFYSPHNEQLSELLGDDSFLWNH